MDAGCDWMPGKRSLEVAHELEGLGPCDQEGGPFLGMSLRVERLETIFCLNWKGVGNGEVRGGEHRWGLGREEVGLSPQVCCLKVGAENWESLTEVTVKASGEVGWGGGTLVLTASSLGGGQGA